MSEQVGFVGLGNMGQPMAANLLKAGYHLRVFDLDQDRMAEAVALGASPASGLADVARPGGVVITMVPDDEALLNVTLSKNGILEQLGVNGTHISTSTISPSVSKQLADRYAARGSTYLAATVLGRPDVAEAAELTIFVSGEEAAKQRALPLLKALGKGVHDAGVDITAANTMKIATNFLIASAIEAMGEAAALIERSGLDRASFLRILSESPLFRGYIYETYGQMIGDNNYSDARFPVPLGLKDVSLAIATGSEVGLELPLAQLARDSLITAMDKGWSAQDWSVLARVASERTT